MILDTIITCENLNKKKVNVKENKNRWSSDVKEIRNEKIVWLKW